MTEFRALMESLRDAVIVHRMGRIVYVNSATLKALGYASVDELVGRSVLELVHPDDRELVLERVRTMNLLGVHATLVEEKFLRKDGAVLQVEVAAMPTTFEGEPAIIALGRDISERKHFEAKLVLADRLASIGRLAASVGHEINNPLAYVLGNINLMKRDLESDLLSRAAEGDGDALSSLPELRARLLEHLMVIEEGSLRVRDIVHDLKRLSHGDTETIGPVDLHRVLDVCINMAEHQIRERARLRKNYGCSALINVNEARLGQVFLNLLVNAAQAIPDGGSAGEHEVSVVTREVAPGRVEVEIADSGTGLDDEVRERLFEPFVTTKPAGSGTGLGLSISHHIVTSLGGTIAAVPREGGGTRFLVTLPTVNEDDDPRKEPSDAALSP